MKKANPKKYNPHAIKRLRTQLGITQHQFASKLGAQAQHVSAWETGKVVPSFKFILKIMSEYGVDCNYFFE